MAFDYAHGKYPGGVKIRKRVAKIRQVLNEFMNNAENTNSSTLNQEHQIDMEEMAN